MIKRLFYSILGLLLAGGCGKLDEELRTLPYKFHIYVRTIQSGEDVYVKVPYTSDIRMLIPEFHTEDGGMVELKEPQSGSGHISRTVDFSNPVTFLHTASDGKVTEFRVIACFSSLPVVYINTPAEITSKEEWMKECSIEILNAGKENALYSGVQMKGRGNFSWWQVKKPYAIKLDKKAEVLGMPKHKRWVLLANYIDRTCMRNAVSFEIARRLPGLDWTPHGRFVDVVVNGRLMGSYYLCEHIKVDANRVNIAEIDPTDVSGDAVTGGYIFELDNNYDELFKFRTPVRNLPVQFKDPDEDIADAQFEYVRNYFADIEDALYRGGAANPYDYIDIDSFVDWWLVHELTSNIEPRGPRGCYMHKDRNGKLKAGPVWDFDIYTFLDQGGPFVINNALWYDALLAREDFTTCVQERWRKYKSSLQDVETYIDALAEEVRESVEGNFGIWTPEEEHLSKNSDLRMSFDEAVDNMKRNYRTRIEVLDAAIESGNFN